MKTTDRFPSFGIAPRDAASVKEEQNRTLRASAVLSPEGLSPNPGQDRRAETLLLSQSLYSSNFPASKDASLVHELLMGTLDKGNEAQDFPSLEVDAQVQLKLGPGPGTPPRRSSTKAKVIVSRQQIENDHLKPQGSPLGRGSRESGNVDENSIENQVNQMPAVSEGRVIVPTRNWRYSCQNLAETLDGTEPGESERDGSGPVLVKMKKLFPLRGSINQGISREGQAIYAPKHGVSRSLAPNTVGALRGVKVLDLQALRQSGDRERLRYLKEAQRGKMGRQAKAMAVNYRVSSQVKVGAEDESKKARPAEFITRQLDVTFDSRMATMRRSSLAEREGHLSSAPHHPGGVGTALDGLLGPMAGQRQNVSMKVPKFILPEMRLEDFQTPEQVWLQKTIESSLQLHTRAVNAELSKLDGLSYPGETHQRSQEGSVASPEEQVVTERLAEGNGTERTHDRVNLPNFSLFAVANDHERAQVVALPEVQEEETTQARPASLPYSPAAGSTPTDEPSQDQVSTKRQQVVLNSLKQFPSPIQNLHKSEGKFNAQGSGGLAQDEARRPSPQQRRSGQDASAHVFGGLHFAEPSQTEGSVYGADSHREKGLKALLQSQTEFLNRDLQAAGLMTAGDTFYPPHASMPLRSLRKSHDETKRSGNTQGLHPLQGTREPRKPHQLARHFEIEQKMLGHPLSIWNVRLRPKRVDMLARELMEQYSPREVGEHKRRVTTRTEELEADEAGQKALLLPPLKQEDVAQYQSELLKVARIKVMRDYEQQHRHKLAINVTRSKLSQSVDLQAEKDAFLGQRVAPLSYAERLQRAAQAAAAQPKNGRVQKPKVKKAKKTAAKASPRSPYVLESKNQRLLNIEIEGPSADSKGRTGAAASGQHTGEATLTRPSSPLAQKVVKRNLVSYRIAVGPEASPHGAQRKPQKDGVEIINMMNHQRDSLVRQESPLKSAHVSLANDSLRQTAHGAKTIMIGDANRKSSILPDGHWASVQGTDPFRSSTLSPDQEDASKSHITQRPLRLKIHEQDQDDSQPESMRKDTIDSTVFGFNDDGETVNTGPPRHNHAAQGLAIKDLRREHDRVQTLLTLVEQETRSKRQAEESLRLLGGKRGSALGSIDPEGATRGKVKFIKAPEHQDARLLSQSDYLQADQLRGRQGFSLGGLRASLGNQAQAREGLKQALLRSPRVRHQVVQMKQQRTQKTQQVQQRESLRVATQLSIVEQSPLASLPSPSRAEMASGLEQKKLSTYGESRFSSQKARQSPLGKGSEPERLNRHSAQSEENHEPELLRTDESGEREAEGLAPRELLEGETSKMGQYLRNAEMGLERQVKGTIKSLDQIIRLKQHIKNTEGVDLNAGHPRLGIRRKLVAQPHARRTARVVTGLALGLIRGGDNDSYRSSEPESVEDTESGKTISVSPRNRSAASGAASVVSASSAVAVDTGVKSNRMNRLGKKERELDICGLQAVALKLLHDIYAADPRYRLDPEQQITQTVSCGDHRRAANLGENQKRMVEAALSRLSAERPERRDRDQDRGAALQKDNDEFLRIVMDPKEETFKHLRVRILASEPLDEVTIQSVVKANPEIFIPQEWPEGAPKTGAEEVLDHQSHHVLNHNPNRRILVDRALLRTFVAEIAQQTGARVGFAAPGFSIALQSLDPSSGPQTTSRSGHKDSSVPFPPTSRSKPADAPVAMALHKFFHAKVDTSLHYANAAETDTRQRFERSELDALLNKQTRARLSLLGMSPSGSPLSRASFGLSPSEWSNDLSLRSYTNELNTQEVLKEVKAKQDFYRQNKVENLNPKGLHTLQTEFAMALTKNNCLPQPLFAKIQDYTLSLVNTFVSLEETEALCSFLLKQTVEQNRRLRREYQEPDVASEVTYENLKSQTYVHTLVIDDCGVTDRQFALLLKTLTLQHRLKTLVYSNNEIGEESVKALRLFLGYDVPHAQKKKYLAYHRVETLHISNPKCSAQTQVKLVEVIAAAMDARPIRKLRMIGFNLSAQPAVDAISTYCFSNDRITELDISHSTISLAGFDQIVEALSQAIETGGATSLRAINFSYIPLVSSESQNVDKGQEDEVVLPRSEELIGSIVENLSAIIEQSTSLLHLDLSGMSLRHAIKPIIRAVSTAKAQTLTSIHLHDNNFDLETKKFILRQLGIAEGGILQAAGSDGLTHKQDQMAQVIEQQNVVASEAIKYQIHKFFSKERLRDNVSPTLERQIQVDLLNHQINQQLAKDIQVVQSELGPGTLRDHQILDPMILTRKIGHPELIFNESPYHEQEFRTVNSEGRWGFFNSKSGKDCYVCQKHSYLQIFYKREKASLDFRRITDPELRQILRDTYSLQPTGGPIFLGSVNNWVLTRLLDVKVYAQLLKGEDDDFSRQAINQRQADLLAEDDDSDAPAAPKHIEHCAKRDAKPATIPLKSPRHPDYLRSQFRKSKQKTKIIRQSISGLGQGYMELTGTASSISRQNAIGERGKQAKRRQTLAPANVLDQDADSSSDDGTGLVDEIAQKEWREIILNCQKYRKELVSINFPYFDGNNEEVYVFSGFVRPGRHVIIIYDPKLDDFFFKDIVVEVRKSDIKIEGRKKFEDNEGQGHVVDSPDFVFKHNNCETEENIRKVFTSDTKDALFEPISMEIDSTLFFETLQVISQNYKTFIDAYKLHLVTGPKGYADIGVERFQELVESLGLVDIRMLSNKVQPKTFLDLFKPKNSSASEQIETRVINRSEFVQKLLHLSHKNYKMESDTLKESETFLDYFCLTVVSPLEEYLNGLGRLQSFRFQYLYQPQVNLVLDNNIEILEQLYGTYLNDNKFTLESATKMLSDANIVFNRNKSHIHSYIVQFLFGLSKQTVVHETGMYFYNFLTVIEFFEFFARVADEVFHSSFAKKTHKSRHLQATAKQPLEIKIIELLVVHFKDIVKDGATKNTGNGIQDLVAKDIQKRMAMFGSDGKKEKEIASGELTPVESKESSDDIPRATPDLKQRQTQI